MQSAIIGISKKKWFEWKRTPSPPPLPPYRHGTPPEQQPPVLTANSARREAKNGGLGPISPNLSRPRGLSCCSTPRCSCPATTSCVEQSRGRCQGDAPGHAQCRCTKNRRVEQGPAAPEGHTWPPTAPTCSAHGGAPTGALVLLHASLLVPSDAAAG